MGTDLSRLTPVEVRTMIRKGLIDTPTAGLCAGYAREFSDAPPGTCMGFPLILPEKSQILPSS